MQSIAAVNIVLLLGSLLVVAGIASSLIASRFGAPLLLVFLIVGMLAGQDGPGGIVFNDYQLTYFVGSLALAVIIFDGGLRTRLSAFRHGLGPAGILATLGVLLTAALTGAVAMLVLGLPFLEGMLVGAVVASTDAAAVFFLMRTGGLQLRRKVNATLEIESSTNDPFAVFLTILLVELILAKGEGFGMETLAFLARQGLIGAGLGVASGFAISLILNRVALPSGLHPLFVVASAVLVYSITAVLDGSGFLAVYLAGLILANRPVRAFASILSFHDAATWLCQIVMFIVLGLLVTPSTLMNYVVPGLLIAIFLIIVARPAAVWLCLTPFAFSANEKWFISWVGLRGAVSIFLAAIPTLSGVPNAEIYFNVAFFVVLVSLLFQGWSVRYAAQRSGVALADPAPDTQRIEIDLPGQLDLEMVGYPILADSPVLEREIWPEWVRLVLVVRDGDVMTPERAGRLKSGDYAYFLVPPERVQRLDRYFAASDVLHEHHPVAAFAFNGDVTLGEIAAIYGAAIEDEAERGRTVTEAFAERFEGRVGIGDRLPIGSMALVATALDDERVTKAALEFDEQTVDVLAGAEIVPLPRFLGRARESVRRRLATRRVMKTGAN